MTINLLSGARIAFIDISGKAVTEDRSISSVLMAQKGDDVDESLDSKRKG